MPGEGELIKVIVGDGSVHYIQPNQPALAVESPAGTRTVVIDAAGQLDDYTTAEDFTVTQDLDVGRDLEVTRNLEVGGKFTPGRSSLGVLSDPVEIASGVLTLTSPATTRIAVAAESSTTDTVDSISYSGAAAGDVFWFEADAGDTITFDDANIDLGDTSRVVGAGGHLALMYDGTSWREISFLAGADNA